MAELWLVPVALRFLIVNTWYLWFFKKKILNVVKHRDGTYNDGAFVSFFTLHYFFAALFGFFAALYLGQLGFDKLFAAIMLIGAVNGYAAYCQWRVDSYSLSFAALTFFMDDVIAMTLGYTVLGETKYLNSGMLFGLFLCAVSVALMVYSKYKNRKKNKHPITPKLLYYVLAYTTIWGFAKFSIRYFALEEASIGRWVFGWYSGAFIVALLVFLFFKMKLSWKISLPISSSQMTLRSGLAGFVIFFGVFTAYWALMSAPITVINPVFFTAQMLPRMLIGLYIFKEIDQLSASEKAYMTLSAIGAVIISLSFG